MYDGTGESSEQIGRRTMTMAGDADRPLAAGARRTAARLPPSWFRERDADELAREADQLARMQQLERDAIAVGYTVRLRRA